MNVLAIVAETITGFQRHRGQWLAAAFAYFTMLAIAPLIIVIVEIAGAFLGQHQSVLNELYRYLDQTAGHSAEVGIRSIVVSTFDRHYAGIFAQIVGWCVFVLAAIGLFASLQSGLNAIWEAPTNTRPLFEMLRTRGIAFLAVIGISLLLIAILGIDTVLSTSSFFPALTRGCEFLASYLLSTCVFALLFAYLPECKVEWRSVWIGAPITALLFVVGQLLLGLYLGRAALSSTYGAFGGLIAFLIWANYSAQILFLGAEFTHVLASHANDSRT